MEFSQFNIKNDLYIDKNIYKQSTPLSIKSYIQTLNLKYLYSDIFENLWFALNNKNLIIINKDLLKFIFKNPNNKFKHLYKLINQHDFVYYKNNQSQFDKYKHLNDIDNTCCFLISFKNLKKYFYSKRKVKFEKIYYLVSIEKLFREYVLYLNTGILFNYEKEFIEKQNIVKTDLKVFYILWDCIKNNNDIIITHHMLNFLDFTLPCIQHTFKKNYNEKCFINFLQSVDIPFEEINYKDERCLNNKEVYNFLLKYYKKINLKNKKWVLLTLKNFKCLLNVLNTNKKQKIISYFESINFLYNTYYKKKIIKNNAIITLIR